MAGPDGKIHGYWQGYQGADEFRDHLAKALAAAAKK
jgi:hypothetical protein